jgi:hypothetical protein
VRDEITRPKGKHRWRSVPACDFIASSVVSTTRHSPMAKKIRNCGVVAQVASEIPSWRLGSCQPKIGRGKPFLFFEQNGHLGQCLYYFPIVACLPSALYDSFGLSGTMIYGDIRSVFFTVSGGGENYVSTSGPYISMVTLIDYKISSLELLRIRSH